MIKTKLNIEFVKSMTGNDQINARDLYKSIVTYTPVLSLYLLCNVKPELSKPEKAIQERIKVLNYPFVFVDNPTAENERKKI